MPALRKPAADGLYVSWGAFSGVADGHPVVIKAGAVLRGDHPAVARWPGRFLPAPAADDEMAAARRAYVDASRAANRERSAARADAAQSAHEAREASREAARARKAERDAEWNAQRQRDLRGRAPAPPDTRTVAQRAKAVG
jgi:hypothetical protein